MSDLDSLDGMAKKLIRTVTAHLRLPEADLAEVDKAAGEELATRSNMLARIVREWVKRRQGSPKKR